MKKWEYSILKISMDLNDNDEIEVNNFGKEGWEIVSVTPITNSIVGGGSYTSSVIFTFKRELE
ncbi:protein of unknown function [Anaerocolumna jejuensis DSM 15929]|uniref:DUF4177 domain-containing protein n=1 Tax=Anaerocolumna jejuensis DSM 15929 TaxID=1121322 RepID=A0A1M6YQ52_9FIRM|nr:DUF4177 domain-containing protein [Anaerocolumna jejuensis]SHL20378.1 protein of unknown function [Anaerocolumna jejuensis DSM 15929]